jgi:hypothetical protein
MVRSREKSADGLDFVGACILASAKRTKTDDNEGVGRLEEGRIKRSSQNVTCDPLDLHDGVTALPAAYYTKAAKFCSMI